MIIYINTNMEQSQIISESEYRVEIWEDIYSSAWNQLREKNLIEENEEIEFVHENSNIPGISFTDDCGISELDKEQIREIVYALLIYVSLTKIIEEGWSS